MAGAAHLERRFIVSLLFGLLVFFGLMLFGRAGDVARALAHFRWSLLLAAVALALLNYLLRFVRWQYYLRRAAIALPAKDSWTVFTVGLAMAITPGKIGEILKAYYLRQLTGTAVSTSTALVFGERFTDLTAIILLAAVGSASLQAGGVVIAIGLGFVVVLWAGVGLPVVTRGLTRLLSVWPPLARLRQPFENLTLHARHILRPGPLFIATLLGLAAWFSECLAFFVIAQGLGLPLPLLTATFIYALGTLIGALSFLPGGLGSTEGSMVALMIGRGIPRDAASAATILVRAATLWLAVLLGLAWSAAAHRRLFIAPNDRSTG